MAEEQQKEMSPQLTLYCTQTPNPIKISIALEELKIPYNVVKMDFFKRTHKEPWYLEINPNGKVPGLTDTFGDGQPIHLWESGSILKYLVEKYDKSYQLWYEPGSRENYELFNWVSNSPNARPEGFLRTHRINRINSALFSDFMCWPNARPGYSLHSSRTN